MPLRHLIEELRTTTNLVEMVEVERLIEESGYSPEEWFEAIAMIESSDLLTEAGMLAGIKNAVRNVARKVGGAVKGAVRGAKAGWQGGAGGKPDDDQDACKKGYKMVFGKCRKIGGEGEDDAPAQKTAAKPAAPKDDLGTTRPNGDRAAAQARAKPEPKSEPDPKAQQTRVQPKAGAKAASDDDLNATRPGRAKPTSKTKADSDVGQTSVGKSGVQRKKDPASGLPEPRKGEDDSHMPRAWHQNKAAEYKQKIEFHKQEVSKVWRDDPAATADRIIRVMDADRLAKHHLMRAGMPEGERKAARKEREASQAKRDASTQVMRMVAANA